MAFDVLSAAKLFKARKDMMPGPHPRDEYIIARIEAVRSELRAKGIRLTGSADDLMLVVDMAVWQYNNRDQAGGAPDWLRARIRERWMNDRAINERAEEAEKG